ncbi:MAG: hypothetical protein IMW89_06410 [Ktedonobacteraceae bacterium]|nr:hypothetical protein [Ktedonobacteraceae bacterium]
MARLPEQRAVHELPPAHQRPTPPPETPEPKPLPRQPRAAVRALSSDEESLFRHSTVARRSLVKQEPMMHTARRAQAALHCDALEEEESQARPQPKQRPAQRRRQPSSLFFAGAGMLSCCLLWLLISGLVAAWNTLQDDLHYGRPRTSQTDADVGHGGVSHFLATNTNGHILVFEVLPGDKGARLYSGPVLPQDQALTPVTLEFRADGKENGRPDMIIHAGSVCAVFLNTGSAFKPAKAGEAVCVGEG